MATVAQEHSLNLLIGYSFMLWNASAMAGAGGDAWCSNTGLVEVHSILYAKVNLQDFAQMGEHRRVTLQNFAGDVASS
ncbi:MAG: hypothetical protein ABI158_07235 [Edaphobacter sp.]